MLSVATSVRRRLASITSGRSVRGLEIGAPTQLVCRVCTWKRMQNSVTKTAKSQSSIVRAKSVGS
jgi:hypothetical protein